MGGATAWLSNNLRCTLKLPKTVSALGIWGRKSRLWDPGGFLGLGMGGLGGEGYGTCFRFCHLACSGAYTG